MEEVIAGMAGYIPLKAIGQRILAQYSTQQFGDFRGTLLGLLAAYNYESSILTTAWCASYSYALLFGLLLYKAKPVYACELRHVMTVLAVSALLSCSPLSWMLKSSLQSGG